MIKKCARYGIKVYVFAVEPMSLEDELSELHPNIPGAWQWNKRCFCTYSEEGEKYCIEATQRLFERLPDLGGFIDITMGERTTNCSGSDEYFNCPRCGKHKRGEVLSHTIDLIKEGMRRAGAKGEFISWTYGQRLWEFDEIRDYVKSAPDDVMLMQNFEDYGFTNQLGKERFAEDYWLSYPGPSKLFEETAKCANENKKHIYAKMQVCCSHELATVPYIPAPGLVFDKYAGAYKYGVEGILQCWYFGNYPSVMSKAAGELSFTDDFSDKGRFMRHLAGILYGKSNAEYVSKAWELFSEGYSNYPVNIMFSYYGPMHDGVVWELQLIPKNNPLPRTWLLLDKPNGDRIGEALWRGHTLDEAITLSERICENWQNGMQYLKKSETGELETLSEALGVLFESGTNILKFYRLREDLGLNVGDSYETLEKMRKIVCSEIENSEKMIELCGRDLRLGYHSEAEGFKFFPEKLRHRTEVLKKLITTEFAEVRKRMDNGMIPLGYYDAENEKCLRIGRDISDAEVQNVGTVGIFKAAYDDENVYVDITCNPNSEIVFCFECHLMHPSCEIILRNGEPYYDKETGLYRPLYGDLFDEEYAKYKIEKKADGFFVTVPKAEIEWTDDARPFKFMLKIDDVSWIKEEAPIYTLGKNYFSADEFGFIAARGKIDK